jgi:hypothetical protein
MLLNEFQNQQHKLAALETRNTEQATEIRDLKRQQSEMQAALHSLQAGERYVARR